MFTQPDIQIQIQIQNTLFHFELVVIGKTDGLTTIEKQMLSPAVLVSILYMR